MRKVVVVLLMFIGVFSLAGGVRENEIYRPDFVAKYSFFVAGHSYGKMGKHKIGLHPPFEDMLVELGRDKLIEFGVLTGDIVETSTVQAWEEVDGVLQKFERPIYFAVGNHDVTDQDLFVSRYGKMVFSFRNKGDLFIIWNSNVEIKEKQMSLLMSALDSNGKGTNNVFIFFHHVLWWKGTVKDKDRPNGLFIGGDVFVKEVFPVLQKINKNIYLFAGDMGGFVGGKAFSYHEDKNVHFIGSGMGAGEGEGVVRVDVEGDGRIGLSLLLFSEDGSIVNLIEKR